MQLMFVVVVENEESKGGGVLWIRTMAIIWIKIAISKVGNQQKKKNKTDYLQRGYAEAWACSHEPAVQTDHPSRYQGTLFWEPSNVI